MGQVFVKELALTLRTPYLAFCNSSTPVIPELLSLIDGLSSLGSLPTSSLNAFRRRKRECREIRQQSRCGNKLQTSMRCLPVWERGAAKPIG
jgi:hypothetical protein